MPWYLTVPGLLATIITAWFLLLPWWLSRPSAAARIGEAFARERERRKEKIHA